MNNGIESMGRVRAQVLPLILVAFLSGFDDNPSYVFGGGKGILGLAYIFETRRSVYLDFELQYSAVLDGPTGDEEARLGLNVWLGLAF